MLKRILILFIIILLFIFTESIIRIDTNKVSIDKPILINTYKETPIGKLSLQPINSDKKKNNVFIKSSYNFSNSFGKKTSLNFGNIKVKLNPFKYNISGL